MTQESKKVSRRQAIKLLTATVGAATMANLPNKWVKPVLKAGVLPAHAQTSPTATNTPTNTPTSTPTNTPTSTPTNTPTATATRIQRTIVSCTVQNANPQFPPDEIFSNDTVTMSATIAPAAAGIQIRRTIQINDNTHPSFGTPDVQTGVTDGSGVYTGPDFDLTTWNDQQYIGQETISILWEFVNPADGTNTCSQTITIIE